MHPTIVNQPETAQSQTRNREQFAADIVRNIPVPMHPTIVNQPETANANESLANGPDADEPHANEPLLENRRSIENFIFDWGLEGIVIQIKNSK